MKRKNGILILGVAILSFFATIIFVPILLELANIDNPETKLIVGFSLIVLGGYMVIISIRKISKLECVK